MLRSFKTILMPFKEVMRDDDGNPKHDKNGNLIYIKQNLVVRHNPYYIIKK